MFSVIGRVYLELGRGFICGEVYACRESGGLFVVFFFRVFCRSLDIVGGVRVFFLEEVFVFVIS